MASLCVNCAYRLKTLSELCWRSIDDENSVFVRDTKFASPQPFRSTGSWRISCEEEEPLTIKKSSGIPRDMHYTPFLASSSFNKLDVFRHYGSCWLCSKMRIFFDSDPVKHDDSGEGEYEKGEITVSFSGSTGTSANCPIYLELNIWENFAKSLQFELVDTSHDPVSAAERDVEELIGKSGGRVSVAGYNILAMDTKLFVGGKEPPAKMKVPASVLVWRSNQELNRSIKHRQSRLPGDDLEFETRLRIIQDWLHECESTHDLCRSSINSREFQRAELPRRLLLVDKDGDGFKLIETDSIRRPSVSYATLSHCWGQEEFLTLKRENEMELKRGKRIAHLAATFRHAFLLARSLGFEYLWIDCLCIIQDSEDDEDWKSEAMRMQIVYGNSALTIAAMGSASASAGIFHPRSQGLFVRGIVKLQNGLVLRSTEGEARELTAREFERSPLLRRGWVQQELAMSRRVLYWTGGQLVWDCCHHVKAETLGTVGFSNCHEYPMWFSIHKKANMKLSQIPTSPKEISMRWNIMARCFATTAVTRARDRYYAISSLALLTQQAFEQVGITTRYFAGIWEHDIFRWLAWHGLAHQWNEGDRTFPSSFGSPSQSLFIPSWSWLHYTGPVGFPGLHEHNQAWSTFSVSHPPNEDDVWISHAELLHSNISYEDGSQTTGPLCLGRLTIKTMTFQDIGDFVNGFKVSNGVRYLPLTDGLPCILRWELDASDEKVLSNRASWRYALLGSEFSKDIQGQPQLVIFVLILQPVEIIQAEYRRIGIFKASFWDFDKSKARAESQAPQDCLSSLKLVGLKTEEIVLV